MSLRAAVLMGALQGGPTLAERVSALGVRGKVALITAGWQEREPEDTEFQADLPGGAVNLRLHARAETVFREDRHLAAAHRGRQDTLRAMQDLYRLRLAGALGAWRAVRDSPAPEHLREEATLACVDAIRDLDAWHLAQCARVRAEFDGQVHPFQRRALARHRELVMKQLAGCEAVAIAGGHVAVLVNRLLMFGLTDALRERPLLAWSGGAMAVSERVVLFHGDPPQGEGICEVLDHGLGLVPAVVLFPEPERRLNLGGTAHFGLLPARFAPAQCLALPAGASVVAREGRLVEHSGVLPLGPAPA